MSDIRFPEPLIPKVNPCDEHGEKERRKYRGEKQEEREIEEKVHKLVSQAIAKGGEEQLISNVTKLVKYAVKKGASLDKVLEVLNVKEKGKS